MAWKDGEYPVGHRSSASIAVRAVLEGWELDPEKRREIVDELHRTVMTSKAEKYKIRAFEALSKLTDKWLEAARIEAARDIAGGVGLDDGAPLDEHGNPIAT